MKAKANIHMSMVKLLWGKAEKTRSIWLVKVKVYLKILLEYLALKDSLKRKTAKYRMKDFPKRRLPINP